MFPNDEKVVKNFVVDRLVQILDKNVALTGFSERRVSLAPHNSDRFAHGASVDFDYVEVHGVEGALGVGGLLEVDVGVAQAPASDHIAAHSDGKDRPSL